MSKSKIIKAIAQTKVSLYGASYTLLHNAGFTDTEIMKSDKGQLAEKIVLATRELHSQRHIDNAVAIAGTSYEKLRRIGLTDFILNEVGKYHCKAGTIRDLLAYKTDAQENPALRDKVLRQLDLDIERGSHRTRKSIETDGREER